MTRTRITAITAAVAVCLGAAAPAVASEVGAQETVRKAGQTSPETVPGTGLKKGQKLPKGHTMIARTVTLEGKEQPRLRLTCASGSALRGLVPDAEGVGFVVTDKGSYVGKRSARVRAFAQDRTGGEVTGTIYALCRKG